ncbi:MAG: neutral/alkaline non-lysosomal ceramidase N-terminal domain-containing protein [Planctomycetota bacterium]|nr:neutral/alkaline non-lysosomal ceramidase N-terminal domain-containing protein [Planctomycetota bacterium]
MTAARGTFSVPLAFLVLAVGALWPPTAPGETSTLPRAGGETAPRLSAGVAVVDVSPKQLPVIVNGGFTERRAGAIQDPLHARCLVLSRGSESLAIVVVDSCMIPRDLSDRAKAAAHERTGIPTSRMLVAATHTHSAPSAMSYCLGSQRDEAYAEQLVAGIAASIAQAHARREAARVGWAVVDAAKHTHCRRWIRRPDRVDVDPFGERTVRAMMHPGYQNPDYLGPAGPVDSGLSVLSVQSASGRPICVLANYSMHYFGGRSQVSADYFGIFARLLEERIAPSTDGDNGEASSPFVAVMSQGTSGDLHWMDYSRSRRSVSIEQYASELAELAFGAYEKIEYHGDVELAMAQTELALRRRLPDEKRLAWANEINARRGDRRPRNRPEVYAEQAAWIHEHPVEKIILQAIRIGDLGITAIPNEVFGVTGLKLKARSPLVPTFNMELANGAAGYIPPPEQHELGGYTTWPARTAGLEVQAEPKIVEAMLGLLEKVAGRKRRPLTKDLYPPEIRANMRRALQRLDLGSYRRVADYDKLLGDRAAGLPGLDRSGGRPAYIGASDGQSEFFAGDIDDVLIHGRALSGEEIRKLAAAEIAAPPKDLVGWWRFDGDLTNSGPSRDGEEGEALGGAPRFVEGRLGRALRLDGRAQAVRIEHYRELKPARAITLAAWIRPSATPDRWAEIYRKEDGDARQLLAIGKTGTYGLWCGLGVGGRYVERGAPLDRDALRDGRWHHVAATFDGRQMAFYLDGREIGRHDVLSRPKAIEVVPADDRIRVAFLGNTLIDRAGRFGYLETELTRLWPDRDIVFRNLGWPGDNVQGEARTGFGPGEYRRSGWQPPGAASPDYGFQRMLEQIHRARPDIVFVGYGSNVAFEGAPGLERFERGMTRLLDTLERAGVRIVLLSPPPREPRGDRWPDLESQNTWLERVASHLRAVAAQRGHLYVDVFGAFRRLSRQRSGASSGPPAHSTDNGIHLNDHGYRLFARVVTEALRLPREPWSLDLAADGSVRSSANRASGLTRTEFGVRLEVLDDRLPPAAAGGGPGGGARVVRIQGLAAGSYALDIAGRRVARGSEKEWAEGVAISRGPDIEQAERLRQAIVAKNRLFFYEFRPQNKAYIYLFRRHERGHHEGEVAQFAALVREKEREISRLRRPLPRHYELVRETDYPDHEVPGSVPRPDVEAELASFEVADGFQVNLFASEPMVVNPININWDERGRAWVATSTIYPHLSPGQEPDDRIIVLEDIDRDGRADKSTVFARGLLVPHSVIPGHGGAFVAQSTDLLFLEDTDGDGEADRREVLFTGFGNADVHHMIHALSWGPGGDLYFLQSIYINSFVETPWGVRRLKGSGIWRLRPEVMRLEVHARGLVNPWGHVFDRWGQSFATDGAGGGGIAYTFPGSAFRSAKGVARTLETLNPGRPKECGLDVVTGRHVPGSWRGDLITSDFRANRVVRYRLSENASGYTSRLIGDVLASSHRSFRPVDVKIGPDGAIYVVDWYSPIIDHGEVDFHHPLRDHRHGRIWRLTAKGRPLVKPPSLDGAPVEGVLAALTLPEAWSRGQARRVLRERQPGEVIPKLRDWLAGLDPGDPDVDHHRLEALWVFQGARVVAPDLLRSVLRSHDHRARAAAVRVLADWSGRLTGAQELLAAAVEDDHPRVRLEAVNALRRAQSLEGVEMALRALDRPLDTNLDYALWLTARELESVWLPALQAGKPLFGGKPHRLAFALSAAGKPASLRPLVDLVRRGEIAGPERRDALELIAGLGGSDEIAMVLDTAVVEAASGSPAALGLLEALDGGAQRGRPPPPNARRVAELLSSEDAGVLEIAARLAGTWKVAEARPALLGLVRRSSGAPGPRRAAALAVARFEGGVDELEKLAAAGEREVRVAATVAWATLDPGRAATAAVSLLVSTTDTAYRSDTADAAGVDALFEAFVGRQGGDEVLAAALEGQTIAPVLAARGIQIAGSSGRTMERLVAALTRAGSLEPITAMPPPDELAALLRAVAERGVARRGEAVFRRDSLRCMTCHAIGGGGGRVGPDLSSLGGSSQPVHLVESLLDPSAKIKEGFETVVVFDAKGVVHSGTVVQRGSGELRIRDVKDRVLTIPESEIQAITGSPVSLMPQGLTQTLRRDDLVDLVRFLSELGRPGPYRLPTERFVRTWRVLDPAASAAQGAATRGLDAIATGTPAFAWRTTYSAVDGALPLGEIPVLEERRVSLVGFTVRAERPTVLVAGHRAGLTVWVDGGRQGPWPAAGIDLEKGAHECVVAVERRTRQEALRIELRDRSR